VARKLSNILFLRSVFGVNPFPFPFANQALIIRNKQTDKTVSFNPHLALPSQLLATILGVCILKCHNTVFSSCQLGGCKFASCKLIFSSPCSDIAHSKFLLFSLINYFRMKCPRRKSQQRKPYSFGAKE